MHSKERDSRERDIREYCREGPPGAGGPGIIEDL